MGSCLSKKSARASSSPPLVSLPENPKSESEKSKTEEENFIVRKDIFIVKHRKSHEIERQEKGEPDADKGKSVIAPTNGLEGGAPLRTSSCTKEEVDAILIQCGRLSRSSSAAENGGKKYSGSKRSYDFDGEGGGPEGDDDAAAKERENRRHQSQGRRRTPSRERDQQRSGGGGGRRVSRSPGRRSESPIAAKSNSRPGKMVSVPATVGGGGGGEAAVKRIQVKRNVSPRARSPARVRASNDNQQQQQPMSLSRSNSRKAENSPYRRNPLAEIDTNIIAQKPNAESKTVQVDTKNNNPTTANVGAAETYGIQSHIGLNVISSSSAQDPKPQSLTRSRSSRLSRDLDIITPETLSSNPDNNNTSSYTALLLEDIHNFHQKNSNTPTPAFTLPPCVTKACSILEAVADLNSSTGSNLSSSAPKKKTKPEARDPILESEVAAKDDLTEPSFHKYVTVRRGTSDDNQKDIEEEEQESSGSNSFAGSQQHWVSSSSWEPNSAESTDRWTSSSTTTSSKVGAAAKRNGIGRGRMGARTSKNIVCNAAAVST